MYPSHRSGAMLLDRVFFPLTGNSTRITADSLFLLVCVILVVVLKSKGST
jgi:hypothetical protein